MSLVGRLHHCAFGDLVLDRGDREECDERVGRFCHPTEACNRATDAALGFTFRDLAAGRFHTVEVWTPACVVDIEDKREDLACTLRGFAEHFLPVPCHINAKRLVKHRALVIADPHGGVNGCEKELDPQFVDEAFSQLWLCLDQQSKGFAVAELIVAPFAEPLKNRVEHFVGVLLQVAVDSDIAGITDLLAQVRRVVDELGAEVGVFLLLR